VIGFGSSGALAGAYGLAVTGAMLVDATLATAVAILVWRWQWPMAALVFGLLAVPDLAFFIANSLKIPEAGGCRSSWRLSSISPSRLGGEGVPWLQRTSAKALCRCASSSNAWSVCPIVSPAPPCS